MIKYIFGLLLIFSFVSHSQDNIDKHIRLKSSMTHSISEGELYDSQFFIFKNEFWRYTFYNEEYEKNDSLTFFITNLINDSTTKVKIHLPNLGIKLPHFSYAGCIAINENYLVIAFDGFFSLYSRNNLNFTFLRDEPIHEQFTSASLYGDIILFSKCKNVPRIAQDFKISLVSYSISQNKYLSFSVPEFNGIQLTHFSPNNYITTCSKKWLVVNPLTYTIQTYDFEGNLKAVFNKPNVWDTTSSLNFFRKLENIPNDRNIKPILDSINKKIHNISHVKQMYCVNDSTILVNYIHDNKYFTDILIERNNILQLFKSDISNAIEEKSTIELDKYPAYFNYFISYFYNNKFIQFRMFSPDVNEIGLKPKEYIKKLDKYFKNHEPRYKMYYFDFL